MGAPEPDRERGREWECECEYERELERERERERERAREGSTEEDGTANAVEEEYLLKDLDGKVHVECWACMEGVEWSGKLISVRRPCDEPSGSSDSSEANITAKDRSSS